MTVRFKGSQAPQVQSPTPCNQETDPLPSRRWRLFSEEGKSDEGSLDQGSQGQRSPSAVEPLRQGEQVKVHIWDETPPSLLPPPALDADSQAHSPQVGGGASSPGMRRAGSKRAENVMPGISKMPAGPVYICRVASSFQQTILACN